MPKILLKLFWFLSLLAGLNFDPLNRQNGEHGSLREWRILARVDAVWSRHASLFTQKRTNLAGSEIELDDKTWAWCEIVAIGKTEEAYPQNDRSKSVKTTSSRSASDWSKYRGQGKGLTWQLGCFVFDFVVILTNEVRESNLFEYSNYSFMAMV